MQAVLRERTRAYQEAGHPSFLVTTSVENGSGNEDVAPIDEALLEDRYLLEVIHAFGIHLPEVDEIAVEGFEQRWDVSY